MTDNDLRDEVRLLSVSGIETQGRPGEHSLHLINREHLTVQGVIAVDSFDDQEIIMETNMGVLTLRGEELHIKQLDLETGHFAVEGCINVCMYSVPKQRGGRSSKGRSLLERLLK